MKKAVMSFVALSMGFQLPLQSFAISSISLQQMEKAVEDSQRQTELDLQKVNDSLLQYEEALATLKAEINKGADGDTVRKVKIGTTLTSTVLIAGGVLMLLRPQITSQRQAWAPLWYGAMTALANSLITVYGTGKMRDWNTSEILEAKEKNNRLQALIQKALQEPGVDEKSGSQLRTLQTLSQNLSQVLDKEDHTLIDKADKAMAALQIVAFVWGVIDVENLGAVRLGSNYVGWTTIEQAIVISFGAMKGLTGLHMVLNPQDLNKVNASLDATIKNIDLSRLRLAELTEKLQQKP